MKEARIITREGDHLLPQDVDPQFPADLAADESVVVWPPVPPWKPQSAEDLVALSKNPDLLDQRCWLMMDALDKHPKDSFKAWLNKPAAGRPFGNGRGLENCPEVCVFQFAFKDGKLGRFPDYFEYGGGVSVMSAALHAILAGFDTEGVVSRSVQLVDRAEVVVDTTYKLVDFTRVTKAVDFANSVIGYHGPIDYHGSIEPAWVEAFPSVRLAEASATLGTIFRQNVNGLGRGIFIPRALKESIGGNEPPFSNLKFENPAFGF